MRLKKICLLAAAGLSACSLTAATATLTLDSNNSVISLPAGYQFGDDVNVLKGRTLTLDVQGNEAVTYSGLIKGEVSTPVTAPVQIVTLDNSGTVVKTGDGTLQIASYSGVTTYYRGSFEQSAPPRALTDASQGALIVNGGTVEVSGYINQFVAFGSIQGGYFGSVPNKEGFLGYSQTILTGNSRLSFTNTIPNVPGSEPIFDGSPDDPSLHPPIARINYVLNLKAGVNNTEANTVLNVGQTSDMHLISHVSAGEQGGVGILEGRGEFAKTGSGTFTLLNRATFSGNLSITDGTMVVGNSAAAQVDNAIASVYGVNLGRTSVGDRFGGWIAGDGLEYRPSLVPPSTAPLTTALPANPTAADVAARYNASLRLEGNQTVNNLQYLFNLRVGVVAGTTTPNMPFQFGNGSNTAIDALDGSTVILNQQLNGVYAGVLLAHDAAGMALQSGTVGAHYIKMGAATVNADGVYTSGALALLGQNSVYRSMTIREGVLLASVQTLGSGDVYIESGGVLQIIQPDVGTLRAKLHGIGGTLAFRINGQIMDNLYTVLNPDGTPVTDPQVINLNTDGQIGSVDATVAQDDFYGNVEVYDGIQMRFSSTTNDVFKNAASFKLLVGANGAPTTLTFNDSNQIFRNFSGDAGTRIDLGQGNVTLVQNINAAYSGIINGFGGLIKEGTGTFTINGRDNIGNSTATYAGATVVREGTLVLGGANQLPNTSGLVMGGGNIVLNGAQTFGTLIGTAGSTVDIGANDLTIGLTDARLQQIRSAVSVTTLAPGNSFYLATTGSGATNSGQVVGYGADTTIAFLFNKPIIDKTAAAVSAAKTAYDAAKTAADNAAADPLNVTKAALAASTKATAIAAAETANSLVNSAVRFRIAIGDAATNGAVTAAGQAAQTAVNAAIANTLSSIGNGFADAAAVSAALDSVATNEAANYVTVTANAVQTLVNTPGTLAFDGSITGTGGLIKQGVERLTLTGVNTYTGATRIIGGVLEVDADALPNTSGVTSIAGTALAVRVDSGSATFAKSYTGAGDLRKTGAGELVIGDAATGYTGSTFVEAGTLVLTLKNTMAGGIDVATGATLAVVQDGNLTLGNAVTGGGTFDKRGTGTLTVTNFGGFSGDVLVSGGRLEVNALSPSPATVTIASGTTFAATVTSPQTFTGRLRGAGAFTLTGGPVTFAQSSPDFSGTFAVSNGAIVAGANDLAADASFTFANASFDLAGTNQSVKSLTGDAVSSIALSGGTLTFMPVFGSLSEFGGVISGTGAIVMNGDGTQRLSTTDGSTPWSGTTTVNSGVLQASVAALGNSVVTINAAGTLALYNNITGGNETYANAIGGTGTIGKAGVGAVTLTNTSAAFGGKIYVSEGELRLDTATGAIGTPAKAFPSVSVASAGLYTVVLKADLAHDSADAANRVTDAAAIDGVVQHGSLAVEGPHTLTFANGQSFTGNVVLRNSRDISGIITPNTGATLDLTASTGMNGTLNGLAGEQGTLVRTGGAALAIVQSVAGTFEGDFDALTNVTVRGSAKLGFTNAVANLGDLTVDGGNLVLDAAQTNNVSLVNNGTLYFDTTNINQVYAGSVSGTGNMIKTGTGAPLDLMGDLSRFTITGAIGVDQGRLVATVASLESAGNITGLITRGEGELALQVDAGDERRLGANGLGIAITGDGKLIKSGDGRLLLGDASNPYTLTSTGDFVIEQGLVGGTFTTSGNLVVATGGTLAPGNSPGTVTVNGNFTSSGTLALELAATGPSDKIVVNGTATLAQGTKFDFAQYGSGTLQKTTGYRVIEATGGVQAAEGDFELAPGSRRVIIVTPARNANVSLLNGFLVGRGATDAVVVYDIPTLANQAGLHDGVNGLAGVLDAFTVNQYALPENELGAALAFASPGSLSNTVSSLSPLGYASFYAMAHDTGAQQDDRLRERMEQRRYDAAGFASEEWEAFVVGSGSFANNTNDASNPIFDYRTYGGQVGFDKRLQDGPLVGGAIGYDNGTANLHDGAGKMEMNHVRATGFLSSMVSNRWFVEGGLSIGLGDYTSERNTFVGRNNGSTTGYDFGFNVNTGTIVTLTEDLHLTPHAGFSYSHYEYEGVTEKGTASALKLDGWSQDSLRFTLGTGLGWWLSSGDWKWKIGADVAYNHEFIDTDSEIGARFATLGGNSFNTTAAAIPQDTLSVGPSVGLHFDETTSVSAGITYEYGFDGRNYANVNVAFRKRF